MSGSCNRSCCLFGALHILFFVGDGNFEVPPLRRQSAQGIFGSCVNRSGSVGEGDFMIGEVVERELVLVVSVRCGKERDMTRG